MQLETETMAERKFVNYMTKVRGAGSAWESRGFLRRWDGR